MKSFIQYVSGLVLATALIYMVIALIASMDAYECVTNMVIAQVGDTMYHIARENCTGDWRSVVSDMVPLNGNTTMIQPGQVIFLPERR